MNDSYAPILFTLETIILIFCFIDSVLGLFLIKSMEHKNVFVKVLSGLANFSLIALFLADYIIYWHTQQLGIRFSSFLRPLWLIHL